ncbi:MAG TPA: cytochrome c biogenesis protein CcdA [Polyangia bacterium]
MIDWTASLASGGGFVALPLAFAGGIVMGLNPCCLALYPAAAVTCCAGSCASPKTTRPMVLRSAALFVLGNALAITGLGIAAAVAGRVLGGLAGWITYVVAAIPLAMGLHLLGWLRLPMPVRSQGWSAGAPVGAFAGGLLLSLVIGPCGTPVVAAILAYAAAKGSVAFAAALLFMYGLGNGLPLLVVGAAAGGVTKRLEEIGRGRFVERFAGVAMVGLGLFLLWTA